MTTTHYRWAGPHEWLSEKIDEWAEQGGVDRLASELIALAFRLSADELQDEYQAEMAEDGYFTPIAEPAEDERGTP